MSVLLPRLIGSAVTMAARISAGQGTSYINMNRREVLQDGTLRGLPFLGRNPNHVLELVFENVINYEQI